MIASAINVRIDRPVEEVFAYVSEPLNLPRCNSAVEALRRTSAGHDGVVSRYVMERELSSGRTINQLDVRGERPAA